MGKREERVAAVRSHLRRAMSARDRTVGSLNRHWRDLAFFAVIAIVVGLGLKLVGRPLHGCNFHYASQFGASEGGFDRLMNHECDARTLADTHTALVYDWIFVVVYGVLFAVGNAWFWKAWRVGRLRGLRLGIVALGPLAAIADAIENLLTWKGVRFDNGLVYRSNTWAGVVSNVALLKWLVFIAAAGALLTGFWATIAPRAQALPDAGTKVGDLPPALAAPPLVLHAEVGVCCSGGGIRAASYTVGALEALERAGVMDKARYLAAVSGGAYAATGWTLRRNVGEDRPAAQMHARLLSGDPKNPQHKYLATGYGGFSFGLLKALTVIGFNIAAIAAAMVTIAWPAGRLLSSAAVQPKLANTPLPTVGDLMLTTRHWLPGVLLLGVALAVVIVRAAVPPGGRIWTTPFARAVAALGLVYLALFAAMPYAVTAIHESWTAGGFANIKALIPTSVVALFAAIWKALSSRFGKILPRLGGIALAIIVFAAAAAIATRAAQGNFSAKLWAPIAIGFGLLFCCVPVQWASLRPLYRDGLRRAFVEPRADRADGSSFDMRSVRWSAIAPRMHGSPANVPELVICATSQQMGLASGGIPGTSLTISPVAVRAHIDDAPTGEYALPTEAYLTALPEPFRSELRTVSAWMALTGAAFSSAMGRQGYGSTNALMAAFNIDLGAWIPNPRLVRQGATDFKRIRLGYLVKEVFGLYDRDDENVFVSDGGQWENLGIVELLRRRCRTIVCIDASGDTPGTFTTLRQAIDLAARALPFKVAIDEDLRPLTSVDGTLPTTATACWNLTYTFPDQSPDRGLLFYAKLQVAADQPSDLVSFGSKDRKFPHYSTGDQFLETVQVRHLIEAGVHAGLQLADMAAELQALTPPAS